LNDKIAIFFLWQKREFGVPNFCVKNTRFSVSAKRKKQTFYFLSSASGQRPAQQPPPYTVVASGPGQMVRGPPPPYPGQNFGPSVVQQSGPRVRIWRLKGLFTQAVIFVSLRDERRRATSGRFLVHFFRGKFQGKFRGNFSPKNVGENWNFSRKMFRKITSPRNSEESSAENHFPRIKCTKNRPQVKTDPNCASRGIALHGTTQKSLFV
jgi:hypothetical protein